MRSREPPRFGSVGALPLRRRSGILTPTTHRAPPEGVRDVDGSLSAAGRNPGDSVSRGHERWIELDSVAWGVTHAAGAGGSGVGAATGRASFAPLQATGAMGSATPPLFLACASGTRIQEAVLEAVSVGAEPGVLARWELENVRVSALTIAGADAPPRR